jgi:hypothetical protein
MKIQMLYQGCPLTPAPTTDQTSNYQIFLVVGAGIAQEHTKIGVDFMRRLMMFHLSMIYPKLHNKYI